MAVLWLDGFETYADITALQTVYSSDWAYIETTSTITEIRSLRFIGTNSFLRKSIYTTSLDLFAGGHWYREGTTSAYESTYLFYFRESAVNQGIKVTWRLDTEKIHVYRNTTEIAVSTNTYPVPRYTTKHFIARVYRHSTNGIVQVWVDGQLAIDFTGNTIANNSTTDAIQFSSLLNANNHIDNIWIADENLGEIFTKTIVPVADGNYSQLTRSAGSYNYENVDEIATPDSVYNYSSTNGHKDSYKYTNNPFSAGQTVRAVALAINAKKSVGDTTALKPLVRYNSTDYTGSPIIQSLNRKENIVVFDKNPVTDSAWQNSHFSGTSRVEFGIEVYK